MTITLSELSLKFKVANCNINALSLSNITLFRGVFYILSALAIKLSVTILKVACILTSRVTIIVAHNLALPANTRSVLNVSLCIVQLLCGL